MHRVESRTYIGQPDETVTLTTQIDGGGQVSVTVDGQDIGTARTFTLPPTAGAQVKLQIALIGPLGASCVVTIAVVDGALDGDFLMCQAHDPAPIHFYGCAVATPAAVAGFARAVAPSTVKTAAVATPAVNTAAAAPPAAKTAAVAPPPTVKTAARKRGRK